MNKIKVGDPVKYYSRCLDDYRYGRVVHVSEFRASVKLPEEGVTLSTPLKKLIKVSERELERQR